MTAEDHQDDPPANTPNACKRLGMEIRRWRMLRGMSQHDLVRLIGLSAHSNLSDYECGRRVPPRDIVDACERILEPPPGLLKEWFWMAVRERTENWFRLHNLEAEA